MIPLFKALCNPKTKVETLAHGETKSKSSEMKTYVSNKNVSEFTYINEITTMIF